MKPVTNLESIRQSVRVRPLPKSTVLLGLVTFLLVIHVVKSSTVNEKEESTEEDHESYNSKGELNVYRKIYMLEYRKRKLRSFPVSHC